MYVSAASDNAHLRFSPVFLCVLFFSLCHLHASLQSNARQSTATTCRRKSCRRSGGRRFLDALSNWHDAKRRFVCMRATSVNSRLKLCQKTNIIFFQFSVPKAAIFLFIICLKNLATLSSRKCSFLSAIFFRQKCLLIERQIHRNALVSVE